MFFLFFSLSFSIGSQYGKCLGNARSKAVVCLETVIWKALFGIARGEIEVYAAEKLIADAIPEITENLEHGDEGWFQLGSLF